ncbi:MAG TPA: hydrogenase formation protein HypD [Bacteroidales bacterium]|nr:hydrogenase formation protein HypD [Bacteroidales bacterium]
MKYIDEYRDINVINALAGEIKNLVRHPWNIMEICGGQTHSIMKYNLIEFLPEQINLVHGPGCPVCVTPIEKIDKALAISRIKDVILASYGDMLRVPGSDSDLLLEKSKGSDIRMVYSPLDAVKIAEDNPSNKVVFFAIGFETTAPVNALSIIRAKQLKLNNYYVLCSQVLVPPAIKLVLSLEGSTVDGFLAPGHVCTVTGYNDYIALAAEYRVPFVITGFEPADILKGISSLVKQLEYGKCDVLNEYSRVVTKDGNRQALKTMYDVFEVCDQEWRGIGMIYESGLKIKEEYSEFDAEKQFITEIVGAWEPGVCIAGKILQGVSKPTDCKAFGKECIPEHPLGAPMVSLEGACSAYYRYQ